MDTCIWRAMVILTPVSAMKANRVGSTRVCYSRDSAAARLIKYDLAR
jgi:hypothetical protein